MPASALHLVPGDGRSARRWSPTRRVAGVAFTGSTEVGHAINRALAAKDGPIVPLIAETGGINAMIVDATALPEQVTDDVITSAFRSAGQRCSALRLLCVQEDVADRMIEMIAGAARELALGDPRDPATHVGPVIDDDAKARLDRWIADMAAARPRALPLGRRPRAAAARAAYVPPTMIALDRAARSQGRGVRPDPACRALARRRARRAARRHRRQRHRPDARHPYAASTRPSTSIVARLANGNVYVNRSMIGAVVGTQPFGGSGLSGTGPKAGGPNYLRRFATEQTVTINTAAAGGNATLLTEGE